jgi:transposase
MAMLFVGVDWGEAHHDLCLLDQDGGVLASRRIADGLAGVGELHALVNAHAQDPGRVVVGIETDRGLLVGALQAAGYQVYAVNPRAVSRYRDRHRTARAKSDRGDPRCWLIWSALTATTIARWPGIRRLLRRSRCWLARIRT